jgi:hypothetical protein
MICMSERQMVSMQPHAEGPTKHASDLTGTRRSNNCHAINLSDQLPTGEPMTLRPDPNHGPVDPKPSYRVGRDPSFTAMRLACLRKTRATAHPSPIFTDTPSVQLVPENVRQQVQSFMERFSRRTADAIVLLSAIEFWQNG